MAQEPEPPADDAPVAIPQPADPASAEAASADPASTEPAEPAFTEAKIPLYQQDPYDEIHFDEHNNNEVYKVQPLDLPNRRVPDPFPVNRNLELRLLDKPESLFEVQWHTIERILLFHDLVLNEANQLVQAGQFEEAYDYFQFLLEEDPELPNLKTSLDNYLYEEAKAFHQNGQYHAALARLRQMFEIGAARPELENAMGMATEKVVEQYVAEDNHWAARKMLRNLADLYPQQEVVKRWEGRLIEEAQKLLDEGRKATEANDLHQAHQMGRRLLHIWPDLAEGQQFVETLQREHPRVMVGVTLPATGEQSGRLHDWASRRTSRLVCRTLTEFLGAGAEGGKYVSPLAEIQTQDLGLRLVFNLQRDRRWSRGTAKLTGYDLARQLLAMADSSDPAYRLDWADLLDRVSVEGVYTVRADLKRPHVRPEALLQIAVPPYGAVNLPGDSYPSNGPYTPLDAAQAEGQSVYVTNPQYFAGNPTQPEQIVEVHFHEVDEAIQAIQRRQIDVLDRVNPWDLGNLRSLKDLVVEPYAAPLIHCLIPNLRRPLIARRAFRRALVYGIQRESILNHLLGGKEMPGCRLVSGPFSPGVSLDDPLGYAYDHSVVPRPYEPRLAIALAEAALSEFADAREKEGGQLEDVSKLVLGHQDHQIARVACESIQSQLELVGITVVLRELPGSLSRIPEDVDLLYAELAMWEPVVDARRLLDEDGLSGGSSPYMSLALRSLDQATSWAAVSDGLRHIHRLANKEVSVIPLWQMTDHFIYHRNLKGIQSYPISLYQDVEAWQAASGSPAEEK